MLQFRHQIHSAVGSAGDGCVDTRLQDGFGLFLLAQCDEGASEGEDIPPYYESLFMLLIAYGSDRADALRVMDRANNGDLLL